MKLPKQQIYSYQTHLIKRNTVEIVKTKHITNLNVNMPFVSAVLLLIFTAHYVMICIMLDIFLNTVKSI